MFLKERKVCKDEEEDISSYGQTKEKGRRWNLKDEARYRTLWKKSLWQLAMDPSQDRLSSD